MRKLLVGTIAKFISALSRIICSLSISWAVLLAAPMMTIAPDMVAPVHAIQCVAFFPSITVSTVIQFANFTLNAGRVLSFTFNLLPGQSLAIIFLGVQKTQTNSTSTTNPYTTTFTVPNTGPTASGNFTYAAGLNGSQNGIDVTGSCDTNTPLKPTSSSTGDQAAIPTICDAIFNPTTPLQGRRLLEFGSTDDTEIGCGKLLATVASAAARLQSTRITTNVISAKKSAANRQVSGHRSLLRRWHPGFCFCQRPMSVRV